MFLIFDDVVYCLFTGVIVVSELIVGSLVEVDVKRRTWWRRDCVNLVYWRTYPQSELQKTSSICYELVFPQLGV